MQKAFSVRCLSSAVQKYTLPDLPYDYGALEPVISAEIMRLHHTKHHQAYVTNLNVAMEKLAEAEAKNDIAAQIGLQQAIKFNGGGHVNHSQFWLSLAPPLKHVAPPTATSPLGKALSTAFGNAQDPLTAFKQRFNAKAATLQGSGWIWLVANKETQQLDIVTTPNQDPVSSLGAPFTSLLGIDLWEHAFYLQYKNMRGDYMEAVHKVIHWETVAQRFQQSQLKQ